MKRSVLRILAVVACTVAAAPLAAQRGDDANRPSKNGHTEGVVAGIEVTIDYGRPLVKGRAVWGHLVPYGKVWRTGANEATTVQFAADALVEGRPLAAGTYALVTIPGEEAWTVVFNRAADQWGAFNYDASQDALRVEVKSRSHDHVEALEFALEKGAILLRWERLEIAIGVASP